MVPTKVVEKTEDDTIITIKATKEDQDMADWDLEEYYVTWMWAPLSAMPLLYTATQIMLQVTRPKVFGRLAEAETWIQLYCSIGWFLAVIIGLFINFLVQEILERRDAREYPPLSDVELAYLNLKDTETELRRVKIYLEEYAKIRHLGMGKKCVARYIRKIGQLSENWEWKLYTISRLICYFAWAVDLVCMVAIPAAACNTGAWKTLK